MEALNVGGETLDGKKVEEYLNDFATREADTVRWYDLNGGDEITASDGVDLIDIGRMTLMNPRLSGADVAHLLKLGKSAPWHLIEFDARLEDASIASTGGLYDAAMQLCDHFCRVKGIKDAKAFKLLHIKRPWLFPILDSQVTEAYKDAAHTAAKARTGTRVSHWEAIRLDLIENADALTAITHELRKSPDAKWQRLALLPSIRLLDIVAWNHGETKLRQSKR